MLYSYGIQHRHITFILSAMRWQNYSSSQLKHIWNLIVMFALHNHIKDWEL
jgi:hypothetical protein